MSKSVEHRSPNSNRAKAPYNFVPLPEKVLTAGEFKAHDKYDSERHTGYIELTIKTETPLYTRCAFPSSVYENPHNFDENGKLKVTVVREAQDFFHHGDKSVPVIPGSTLRGMTRSLVEIFSYSKINFVTDSQLVYRSISDKFYRKLFVKSTTTNSQVLDYPLAKVKGGYLKIENGKHYILPAQEDGNGESFVHVEYKDFGKYVTDFSKQKVYENFYIKPPVSRLTRKSSSSNVSLRLAITNKITNVDEEGLRKVNVVVSGQMQNKHMHCAVYELDEDAKPIGISEERWKIYQEDYKKVWDKKKPQRELKSGEPLFYFLDEKGEPVFGPTMMFRIPYNNTVRKFLDEDSKKLNTLDFTDAIFGKVPEKKDSAQKPFAGRVYFSDAVCQTVNPFLGGENDGRRVPKILSSPKPTAFQMYLNQPEPDNSTKKNYNNINETQIRGFKRYWHQPKITPDDVFDREQNIENVGSQHTIIRPVKPETNFKSRVYFENLSGIELGALLTALELPPNMRHQIGMAKPYGFGSIKITPALVLQNREVRYAALFNENNWMTGTDNNLTKDFKGEFEKTLIEFCKEIYGREEIKSLNEIPRIRQLYVLLEWEPNPNLKEKTYCNLQFEDRNGKKRAERQWRDRHVLPYPEHINSGESGELEFGASETENLENNNLESGKRVEEKEPEPQSHTFLTRPMVKKKT